MKINHVIRGFIILLSIAATTPITFAADNPMERIGIDHNRYLDCAMRSSTSASESPLRVIVDRCGFDAGMDADALEAQYGFMVDMHVGVSVLEGAEHYRGYFSQEEHSYISRIDMILKLDLGEAETYAMLEVLESEAIAELNSDSRTGQAILAALSTARHSLRFWAASGRGGTGGARFPWNIVGADLLGALGGTLIGGPVMGTALGVACSMSAGNG
jgi:hypothetical protein